MTTNAQLEAKITAVILKEGGDKYTDHPSDRGGPTRWGVTEAVARAFGYTGDMRTLPESIARQIYRERFWFQPNFHQVNELSVPLAKEMLDTGINMGTVWPGRFLQRSLNALNARAKHYPDIEVDGRIGPMTLHCLKSFLLKRGAEGEATLVRMVDSLQSVRYLEISEANPTQEDFQYGWQSQRIGAHA